MKWDEETTVEFLRGLARKTDNSLEEIRKHVLRRDARVLPVAIENAGAFWQNANIHLSPCRQGRWGDFFIAYAFKNEMEVMDTRTEPHSSILRLPPRHIKSSEAISDAWNNLNHSITAHIEEFEALTKKYVLSSVLE